MKTVKILKLATVAILLCASVFCVAIYLLPTNTRDNSNPKTQAEMLKITLQVGDLAPIPAGGKLISVTTEGNPFTRSFRVKYSAPPSVIKKWLAASNGIKNAKIEKTGKTIKYLINAKLGYQYAEVVVDFTANIVSMYVYWS
ncbi:MAG: hypothetical protein NT018_00450 [Armatimonadetes bacterium]|nr:hypothetical protein [Armatimonadota bacterium]